MVPQCRQSDGAILLQYKCFVDRAAFRAYRKPTSRLDGHSCVARKGAREESPGSTRIGCRVTPGGGDPRESATENKLPQHAAVRVKRCGKSAPQAWQQDWHGKPHLEQDRIGVARHCKMSGLFSVRHPGWLREALGNKGSR